MSMTLDQVFLEAYKEGSSFDGLNSETKTTVQELSKQINSDFASPNGDYYSLETQENIAREAAHRLSKVLSSKAEASRAEIQKEWGDIVGDFYRTQGWGHPTQKTKPKKVLSQDQKIVRELAPYIWVAFQAWVIMKLIIYYFGIEAADNPDETPVFLYLGIAFSFFSLFFFAWRKFKKGD
ncbi:hypothetical protein [Bdellovibrio sp. HCB337]|uniref:hypothetical protein n=1 Tax=Bdellovibrio sp. HCB337 TaxID=3394358 RepID=UPI0039A52660